MTMLQIIFIVGLVLTAVAAICMHVINKQFDEITSFVPDRDERAGEMLQVDRCPTCGATTTRAPSTRKPRP